jgi:hypothetical protein
MHSTDYRLRVKSHGMRWGTYTDPQSVRLSSFTLRAECHGKDLGGNNIQAVVGAPDQPRRGLDEEPAMLLSSGWWVALRNQFARAPDVALEILGSAADDLAAITSEATAARGAAADEVRRKLFSAEFLGSGPDYWS